LRLSRSGMLMNALELTFGEPLMNTR
jgi:hypothetical protein